MSETALALNKITAVELFKPGASRQILDKTKDEARALAATFDVSTPAGEAGLRSLAALLGKTKQNIDKERIALVADEKKRLKVIDTEGGIIWDELEALQKEVRQPLTDLEAARKARIEGHEAALALLVEDGRYCEVNWQNAPLDDMRARLAAITNSQRDWQEFLARARVTVVTTIGQIKTAIAQREKMDADAAELEALRAAAAIQAQKDRDAQIAREAREAAESAARERAAEQAREAEKERQRIEDERIQAEARAKQAEAQREQERIAADEALRAAQEQAREAAEQAERTRLATEEAARLAEARRVEAEEKAAREAEEAAQRHAEQVRLAEEETRAAIAKAKKDAEDAAEQHVANLEALRLKSEGEKRAADEQREREAKEAEERAETARKAAVEAERKRVADETARIKAEADAREKDKTHRASVHDEAEAALIAGGMGKTAARMAVTIIAREQVPHIKISY